MIANPNTFGPAGTLSDRSGVARRFGACWGRSQGVATGSDTTDASMSENDTPGVGETYSIDVRVKAMVTDRDLMIAELASSVMAYDGVSGIREVHCPDSVPGQHIFTITFVVATYDDEPLDIAAAEVGHKMLVSAAGETVV